MAGLARVGPTDAATLSTLEPVGTAVLAVTLLGETLAPLQILGGALIVGAAVVVARSGQTINKRAPVRSRVPLQTTAGVIAVTEISQLPE
jgi:drug/metabolite transporter (DMT)-like permease